MDTRAASPRGGLHQRKDHIYKVRTERAISRICTNPPHHPEVAPGVRRCPTLIPPRAD